MFQTVDWTKPDLGGLLSQVIVKEERQLNEPKPRVRVRNIPQRARRPPILPHHDPVHLPVRRPRLVLP